MKEKNMEIFDVDAQLDATFGKEGTPERAAAEMKANAFLSQKSLPSTALSQH